MSDQQRKHEIKEWEKERKLRIEARNRCGGLSEIPAEEVEDYKKTMSEARARYSLPPAPAMPCVSYALNCKVRSGKQFPAAMPGKGSQREHQDQLAPKGNVSEEWFALVHTPINSLSDALAFTHTLKYYLIITV